MTLDEYNNRLIDEIKLKRELTSLKVENKELKKENEKLKKIIDEENTPYQALRRKYRELSKKIKFYEAYFYLFSFMRNGGKHE